MKIFSPIYFLFLGFGYSLKINHVNTNYFFPFNNDILKNPVVDNPETVQKSFELLEHKPKMINTINHFFEDETRIIGKKIVLKMSSMLPHVDSIGHNVLHANNEFISDILSHDSINDEVKKEIILFSIRMAQHGDDFGSHLLQFYYNMVDYCL